MQNIYIDTHMKCDKETISSAKCVQNPLDKQTKPNQTTKQYYTKAQNETTKTEKKTSLTYRISILLKSRPYASQQWGKGH